MPPTYMLEDEYDKSSTKYKSLGNFYIYQKHADKILKELLHTNRITIPEDVFSLKRCNNIDNIYIRALYKSSLNSCGRDLLVSNDARRRISTLYNQRVELQNFKEKLLSRIYEKFGYSHVDKNHCSHFLSILKQLEAITAGSFPLQVFLDENWVGSDLDIFIKMPKTLSGSLIHKYLEAICFSHKILTPMDMQNNHYAKFKSVHEYTLTTGFRIQIICLDTVYMSPDSVISQFDFDFCKIAWCFVLDKLYITNRKSIETRSCTYDLKLKRNNGAERLHKYQLRGFSITNLKPTEIIEPNEVTSTAATRITHILFESSFDKGYREKEEKIEYTNTISEDEAENI
ncbi:MAG: hypothetical protein WD512_20390 [Candidatus Paceibacterota bacterium]